MKKWPNFFLIGATRSGSTSLYYYLGQQPKIFLSLVKAPKYYSPLSRKLKESQYHEKEECSKLFDKVKNEIAIGEGSNIYLFDPDAAKAIHSDIPNAEIIAILRNPVDRYFVMYLRNERNKGKNEKNTLLESFEKDKKELGNYSDVNNPISQNLYSKQIKRYVDVFGKDQVKILIFEEFIKNVKGSVKDVLNFLDIREIHEFDEKVLKSYSSEKREHVEKVLDNKLIKSIGRKLFPKSTRLILNKKLRVKNIKKSELSDKERTLLRDYFNEDIQKLEKIIGRKLQW